MVIDNFTQFDFDWMVSSKPIGFFRTPEESQPLAAANDNDGEKKQPVKQNA